jgi:hypothetical protein
LDDSFPKTLKLGGLANAGAPDQPAVLFAHGDMLQGGGIVVALQGAIEIHTITSQGCRPVGEPVIVTRARGNVIKELNAGKPAEVLRRIYDALNPRDLARFNTSMYLGVDLGDDSRSRYGRGDFLIRNILGMRSTLRFKRIRLSSFTFETRTPLRPIWFSYYATLRAEIRCRRCGAPYSSRALGAESACSASPITTPTCSPVTWAPCR